MTKKYILTREQKKKYAEAARIKYANRSEEEKKIDQERHREYAKKHRIEINDRQRERYKAKMSDPEYRNKRRAQKKRYKKNKKIKDPIYFIGDHIRESARNRNIEAPHKPKEYRDWYDKQKKICNFCGNTNETIKSYLSGVGEKITKVHNRLHVERLDSLKGYLIGNLALACYICNSHKSDIISSEDFKEIAEKYIKPKIKLFFQAKKNS